MKQKCRQAIIVALSLLAVVTQPALGISIPGDTSVGTWNRGTRTYTLTTDVYETIEIDEDDLTLDGAGYTVTATLPPIGIYVPGRTGVTVQNVEVQGCETGIYVDSGSGNTVTHNTASDNLYGIDVMYSANSIVTNNTASSNGVGIWASYSSNSLIANNTALDNRGGGIYLFDSDDSTVKDNTVFDNNVGMCLHTAHNNTVTGNTSIDNNLGICFWYSSNNLIYNNNLIDNIRQTFDDNGTENVFNRPASEGGNYWSDHTGPDADIDGFVDSPYLIYDFDGDPIGQDDLPWTVQDGWRKPDVRIAQLVTEVSHLDIQQGTANSLESKLDAVRKALDDGNKDNDVAAVNALGAFINAVDAQRGGKISEEDADSLIDVAQQIIDLLTNS